MQFTHQHARSTAEKRAAELARLVYELLDAHMDTEELLSAPHDELRRSAHLDYVRDLQRVAREVLAHAS